MGIVFSGVTILFLNIFQIPWFEFDLTRSQHMGLNGCFSLQQPHFSPLELSRSLEDFRPVLLLKPHEKKIKKRKEGKICIRELIEKVIGSVWGRLIAFIAAVIAIVSFIVAILKKIF